MTCLEEDDDIDELRHVCGADCPDPSGCTHHCKLPPLHDNHHRCGGCGITW